jgi:alcohol dehydrogenase
MDASVIPRDSLAEKEERSRSLLCSRNALSADFSRIIDLIEAGRLDTRAWITHRAAFEELIDVFPSYTRPETGVIKAVVAVGEEA